MGIEWQSLGPEGLVPRARQRHGQGPKEWQKEPREAQQPMRGQRQRLDKQLGTPKLGVVSGLDLEGSAREKGWRSGRPKSNA